MRLLATVASRENSSTDATGDDLWLSDVRSWRARHRRDPIRPRRPGKPAKPDREQGPIASFLTVAGILLGALFFFGWIVLNMNPSNYDLLFSPEQLPAADVGVAYEQRIAVFHNASPLSAATVIDGELPPGLSIVVVRNDLGAVADLRISGRATSSGNYNFTLFVTTTGTDVLQYHVAAQSGSHDYAIVVN